MKRPIAATVMLALALAGCTTRAAFLDTETRSLDELTGLDAQIIETRNAELAARRWGDLRGERLRTLRAEIAAIEGPPRRTEGRRLRCRPCPLPMPRPLAKPTGAP